MMRFVLLALVAACAVSASSLETLEGPNRGLKCIGSECTAQCQVKTTVIVGSNSEYKVGRACRGAVQRISTAICKDAAYKIDGNTEIIKTLNVSATAVGRAVAEASIEILSGVSYKGSCDYGSQGSVKARAAALAFAKATATATAQALVKVYGKNALASTGAWVEAMSTAITSACSTAIVRGFSKYTYPVGPPSNGWVTYTRPPIREVTQAVARAVATAYAEIVAKVTLDVNARKFPCDAVCPECPPY